MNDLELCSSNLKLRLAAPGTNYKSTRFDWSSQAVSVIFANHQQCASSERPLEHPLYSQGGQGLACEFGIRTPIGYTDCAVGDWFPKLGVGFIQRENAGEYDFFHHYAVMRPLEYQISHDLPVDVPSGSQSATIIGTCSPYRGYAWTMSRTWIVRDNTIENRCSLRNTGDKVLETTEYCHNFIQPGNAKIGPQTFLEFGFPLAEKFEKVYDPSECLDGGHPIFKAVPQGEFFIGGLLDKPAKNTWWQMHSPANGLTIRETLDQACIRADLWGNARVISPELFVLIRVEPGKSQNWNRIYKFTTG